MSDQVTSDHFRKCDHEKKLTLPSVMKSVNKSCETCAKNTSSTKTRSKEIDVMPEVKKPRSFLSTRKRTASGRKSLTADAIRSKNKEISDKMCR